MLSSSKVKTQKKNTIQRIETPSIINGFLIYFVIPFICLMTYVKVSELFHHIDGFWYLVKHIDISKSTPEIQVNSSETRHELNPTLYSNPPENEKKRESHPTEPTSNGQPHEPGDSTSTSTKPTHGINHPSHRTTAPVVQVSNAANTLDQNILKARQKVKSHPNNIIALLDLADALHDRDLQVHDGGSTQNEAMEIYSRAIQLITIEKASLQDAMSTDRTRANTNINDEIFLQHSSKSIDGLFLHAYCRLAQVYYMSNMFESAVEAYSLALKMSPTYLDALNNRGSTFIILGKYKEAAIDYMNVLQHDTNHLFIDAFTGIVKILSVKEDYFPGGWDAIVPLMENLIASNESELLSSLNQNHHLTAQAKAYYANNLKHLYLALFAYHDQKTLDTNKAWENLTKANHYKLFGHAPYNREFQEKKIEVLKQVFTPGFWVDGIGSKSQNIIFIVGFVRSGSTLLERILDSHPMIVGTGEDSIFNGRLNTIRTAVVDASMSGSLAFLQDVVQEQADTVESLVKERWIKIRKSFSGNSTQMTPTPKRFVDKMLTNYMNIGFIHLLYPKALILHVVREPMDTLWSAYKHDFPPGDLDYTSETQSLSHLYRCYRNIMKHWDSVLPGRVTHIRYEDLILDFNGVAKAVINAVGVTWDPDVLNFHTKKHAVNTLSTTQVRRGIYQDSIQSWKRYEEKLIPLKALIGNDALHLTKTTLKGYSP